MSNEEAKIQTEKQLLLMTKTAPDGYEMVLDLAAGDKESSIQGFIAIHNTFLGPALGGTRVWRYDNNEEALRNALKLSRAMTYKCAVAGLPFGGGKGVIILNGTSLSLDQVLKLYAEKVSLLKGQFYTGEDVGMTEENVQYMLKFSPFFIGKTGQAGDPSNYAALSTFYSIKVALEEKFGDPQIKGRKFVVKGVGKTGSELVRLLSQEGGDIIVSDTDKKAINSILCQYPNVQIAPVNEIEKQKVDVFCPCALGDDITAKNISDLGAKIIVGTANSQLETDKIGDDLFDRGILHVPDYVANAGGLIDVADELLPGGYNKDRVMSNIYKLKDTLKIILKGSREQNISPNRIANQIAEGRFTPMVSNG